MTSNQFLSLVEELAPSNEESLAEIIDDAKDWCHCFGLAIRTPEQKGQSDITQIAPFALFPSPVPKSLFMLGLDIQPYMSKLYFRVAYDTEFLLNSLKSVTKCDQFTRKMVEILKTIKEEGISQDITLVIQRSDYMCHCGNGGELTLKQIEVNNIAASMGALSERVSRLHAHILYNLGVDVRRCPQNESTRTITQGIHSAWRAYQKEEARVLIIVEEVNQNAMDQRAIEYKLERDFGIKCIRLTLTQCCSRLSLSSEKELLIDGGKYIASVVYFRAGYDPSSYPTNREWDARLLIERSMAIKCPWIGLQLANTKKIQQELAKDGVLERYLADDVIQAEKIRQTFAGLWGLDDSNIEKLDIFQDALINPIKYVLKPQLEGGARNYYGEEVAEKLSTFSADERAAHILMERITPLVVKNYLVRAFSTPKLCRVVGELGFFGTYLGSGKTQECLFTCTGGHILRTKYEDVDEGGVAIGAAVIDSPYLI